MPELDINQTRKDVQQYVALKDEIGGLTKRHTTIKERIRASVVEHGETNSAGHVVLQVDDPVTGIEVVTNQKRVSKTLDLAIAEQILQDKGLHDQCLVTVKVLDEDAIMAAYHLGKLTEEDIDAMFPAKVTYAFII